jgi:hypothetical protein
MVCHAYFLKLLNFLNMRNLLNISISLILCTSTIYSQIFTFKDVGLFGLQLINPDTTGVALMTYFYDIDNDNDLDAIAVGLGPTDLIDQNNPSFSQLRFFMTLQENRGSNRFPDFAPRIQMDETFNFPSGYFFPAFNDFNADGIMDMWVCCDADESLNLKPVFYKGQNESGKLTFGKISSDTFRLNSFPSGSFMMPEVKDMDKDGDLDIIMSGIYTIKSDNGNFEQMPGFYYAKNNGTLNELKLAGWYPDPFGFDPGEQVHFVTAGDLDNDGDNDLLSLTTFDTITYFGYFENMIRPDLRPDFVQFNGSILNLPVAGEDEVLYFPTLVDIDGDGDLDIIVTQNVKGVAGIAMYENHNCDGLINTNVSTSSSNITATIQGMNYQWRDCNEGKEITGATNRSYTPTKSGKYEVMITSPATGCIGYSDCIDFIVSATEDSEISNKIIIHPNPAGNIVEILNQTALPLRRVTFINSLGVVSADFIYEGKKNVDISHLPIGSYALKIEAGDYIISKKLVIIR